ncbi:hypothetical protein HaLaN_04173 [Haematococcus lacustris]|uniref:Uncharacterized protein n=1 Tax=Haematococcus lacustris TaxID=44745 RepID=A0A699Z154_HAELA|nr:hypothetical protein HaLaN_04173 [Haematococcus lacustris]
MYVGLTQAAESGRRQPVRAPQMRKEQSPAPGHSSSSSERPAVQAAHAKRSGPSAQTLLRSACFLDYYFAPTLTLYPAHHFFPQCYPDPVNDRAVPDACCLPCKSRDHPLSLTNLVARHKSHKVVELAFLHVCGEACHEDGADFIGGCWWGIRSVASIAVGCPSVRRTAVVRSMLLRLHGRGAVVGRIIRVACHRAS